MNPFGRSYLALQPCRILSIYSERYRCCCCLAVVKEMEDATMGAILLWLLGVPIPIIIILLLLWH
jgi:hypothetical protein